MKRDAGTTRRWLLPAVAGVFFLSGASALIYQVLWLRLLSLVFGVTVYAASTVWAAFMAGLAVGSLAGRLADRARRPLVWFASAELGIGLSAASTPWLFNLVRSAYPHLPFVLHGGLAAQTLVRFVASFVVLLVPTALMGSTLPLVVKSSAGRGQQLGRSAGMLYGSNTAGAIAGALAAGLYFIPSLGTVITFRLAGLLNLIAAAAAFGLAAATGSLPAAPGAHRTPAPVDVDLQPIAAAPRRVILAVFAVSGGVALALEVIWLRVAVIVVGGTVYTISVMLSGTLLGIAAGSYVVAPFLRRPRRWLGALAWLEAGIAMSGLASLTVMSYVPAVAGAIPARLVAAVPEYLVPVIAASLLVALPTSFLMGAAFPIGLHLWTSRGDEGSVASRVGLFYSLNVSGAIAGSLAAGFALLPTLGSWKSLVVVCSAPLLSAVALIAFWPAGRLRRAALAAAIVSLFVLVARRVPEPVEASLRVRHPNEPILWHEEGIQSTVSVQSIIFGRRKVMYIDGHHQADDTGGMAFTHHRIGTLPLALHPNPHTGLVIGLGGGATAGALARFSKLDLDVVELSETVVRASELFRDVNFAVLSRPNVHLRIDDGRNFLALTRNRYNIITADLIQPIRAGASSLYSVEYFALVRNALNDDGLALQWFSGTDLEYRLVARTFQSVFPETTVWADGTLLVGAKRPLRLQRGDFDWKLEVPDLRDALAGMQVTRFEDLVALFRASPDDLRKFLGNGPILSDDKPTLEYFLSLPRATDMNLAALARNPNDTIK